MVCTIKKKSKTNSTATNNHKITLFFKLLAQYALGWRKIFSFLKRKSPEKIYDKVTKAIWESFEEEEEKVADDDGRPAI